MPGNVTNKGSWTPNTLIKQGAKLVATWEDVWEDLPSQVRLELEAGAPTASKPEASASLMADPVLRPRRPWCWRCCAPTRACKSTNSTGSNATHASEVFTALFDWRWRAEYGAAGEELRANAVEAGNRE